jgi:hypothetical protein
LFLLFTPANPAEEFLKTLEETALLAARSDPAVEKIEGELVIQDLEISSKNLENSTPGA